MNYSLHAVNELNKLSLVLEVVFWLYALSEIIIKRKSDIENFKKTAYTNESVDCLFVYLCELFLQINSYNI